MYNVSVVWDGCFTHDPENLEKVQLCAARIVNNEKTHPKSSPPFPRNKNLTIGVFRVFLIAHVYVLFMQNKTFFNQIAWRLENKNMLNKLFFS